METAVVVYECHGTFQNRAVAAYAHYNLWKRIVAPVQHSLQMGKSKEKEFP